VAIAKSKFPAGHCSACEQKWGSIADLVRLANGEAKAPRSDLAAIRFATG